MARVRRVLRGMVVERGVPATPAPQPPQVWQLAAKRTINATNLVRNRNDQLGQFFLRLALAFNDLKGLVMFEQYLVARGRPREADFSPHAGQWRGATVQCQRWIAGVLHEILNVIGAPRNRVVVNGVELRGLVDSLGEENQRAWRNLVTVARAPMNQRNMTTLLHRIRNWTAFHYDGQNLGDGFSALFGRIAAANPTEANRAAQFSLGVDMDATRFFYADAAAQQVMASQLALAGANLDEVFGLASEVNLAIAALLRAFIESRDV